MPMKHRTVKVNLYHVPCGANEPDIINGVLSEHRLDPIKDMETTLPHSAMIFCD
jgi:hypothetical protein